MNIEMLRNYCLQKEGTEEALPFGPTTLVFKVNNKIYALTNLDSSPLSINLKCDPDKALILRENFECIRPGYHMNKKHWNTVVVEDYLTDEEIIGWIDDSYDLVKSKSKKK